MNRIFLIKGTRVIRDDLVTKVQQGLEIPLILGDMKRIKSAIDAMYVLMIFVFVSSDENDDIFKAQPRQMASISLRTLILKTQNEYQTCPLQK